LYGKFVGGANDGLKGDNLRDIKEGDEPKLVRLDGLLDTAPKNEIESSQ